MGYLFCIARLRINSLIVNTDESPVVRELASTAHYWG